MLPPLIRTATFSRSVQSSRKRETVGEAKNTRSSCHERLVTTATRPNLASRPIKIPTTHTHVHIYARALLRTYTVAEGRYARVSDQYPTYIRIQTVDYRERRGERQRERGEERVYHESNTTGALCPVSTGPWPYFKVPLGVASSCTP